MKIFYTFAPEFRDDGTHQNSALFQAVFFVRASDRFFDGRTFGAEFGI